MKPKPVVTKTARSPLFIEVIETDNELRSEKAKDVVQFSTMQRLIPRQRELIRAAEGGVELEHRQRRGSVTLIIMPALMILLSVGSSAVYLCEGDVRRTIYWAAAAAITASVTF